MTKQVYLAGHMLDKASIMLRNQEKQEVIDLGYKIYSPVDNKEINDKANANPEGLAERIVRHDTDAILASDIIIIEPQPYALGTHVELGQVLGMKDLAEGMLDCIDDTHNNEELRENLTKLCLGILDKKVYVHMEDIRRQGQTETGDRRSWAVNQYVYGAALKLTDGKGFTEWEEIKNELR